MEDYDLAAEAAERAQRAAEDVARYAEQQAGMDEFHQNPPQAERSSKLAQKLADDAARARGINQKLQ